MKAIETVYKGYRFRSRLEARWAVFLDALGWEWEYEKEGFELGGGIKYLPDFFIPRINTWIEIKPEAFTPEEKEKCRLLSAGLGSDHFVVMASGVPENQCYKCFSDGEECMEVTFSMYVRSKGWYAPYFGGSWDDQDIAAMDLAKSARFEYGQSGARI